MGIKLNSIAANVKSTFSPSIIKTTLLAGLMGLSITSTFSQAGVVTSFEGISEDGDFSIGEVTFKNGKSRTVGIPALYRTGAFAWMIYGTTVAEITFEQPASRIEFWVNVSNGIDAEARVIDVNGNVMFSVSDEPGWQRVQVNVADGDTPIGKVEIENKAGNDSVVVVVPLDDFIYVESDFVPIETCVVEIDDPVVFNIQPSMGRMLPEKQAEGFSKLTAGQFIGDSQTMLVAEQAGQIRVIDLTTGDNNLVLDISSQLVSLNTSSASEELGLVSMTLHPDFVNNGLFYTFTSETSNGSADFGPTSAHHQSVITEYQVDVPASIDMQVIANSQREILRINQPSAINAAGSLAFDDNNMLFIGLGAGDDNATSDGYGQNTNAVQGKILRIDPAGSNGANGNYGVPTDNPFVNGGGLAEIYALGFNHPSQMSLENDSGDMYVVDRGQSNIQELNLLSLGGNFGASVREGEFGFNRDNSGVGTVVENCDNEIGSTDPLQQYDRDDGMKILGGYSYQGGALPYLQDRYVFADADGRLLHMNGEGTVGEIDLLDRTGSFGESVTAFARDSQGDIYVMSNANDTMQGTSGNIYKLLPELQIAQADTANVDEDSSVVIDVLANDDNSVEIDPTSVVINMQPFNGSVAVNSTTGAITYTPEANFFGEDVFSYFMSYDKDGATIPQSNDAMVVVDVAGINDVPQAVGDSSTVAQDSSVNISVLSNDTDVDGNGDIDNSSVTIVAEPASGGVSVNGSGVITYTPNAGFNGADSFTYTIADNSGAVSEAATVNVTVTSPPTPTPPSSGGGSLGIMSLLFSGLIFLRRKFK